MPIDRQLRPSARKSAAQSFAGLGVGTCNRNVLASAPRDPSIPSRPPTSSSAPIIRRATNRL